MSQSHPNQTQKKSRYQRTIYYKDKPYEVNFRLLSSNAKYFANFNFEQEENIKLPEPEKPFNVSNEVFDLFIRFCQDDDIEIEDSTVFDLLQLADLFEVEELKKSAENYITEHPSLNLQEDIYKLSSGYSNEEMEKNVSSHFFEVIEEDQLLNIPIHIIYRIIYCYELNINELNETDSDKLLNFLFKILKKSGRKASVLFVNLDIERTKIDYIPRLISEFSDSFDFNMLNPKLGAKTIRDLLEEIRRLKLECQTKVDDMSNTISVQSKNYDRLNKQMEILNGKLSDLEAGMRKQIQLNETLKRVETKTGMIDKLVQRVSDLETKPKKSEEKTQKQIHDMESKLANQIQLNETIQNVERKTSCISELNQRVCELEKLSRRVSQIENNSVNRNEFDSTIRGIESKVSVLSSINQEIQGIKTQLRQQDQITNKHENSFLKMNETINSFKSDQKFVTVDISIEILSNFVKIIHLVSNYSFQ